MNQMAGNCCRDVLLGRSCAQNVFPSLMPELCMQGSCRGSRSKLFCAAGVEPQVKALYVRRGIHRLDLFGPTGIIKNEGQE